VRLACSEGETARLSGQISMLTSYSMTVAFARRARYRHTRAEAGFLDLEGGPWFDLFVAAATLPWSTG
jgi:hypothetical protein